jgi:hypothetical protein
MPTIAAQARRLPSRSPFSGIVVLAAVFALVLALGLASAGWQSFTNTDSPASEEIHAHAVHVEEPFETIELAQKVYVAEVSPEPAKTEAAAPSAPVQAAPTSQAVSASERWLTESVLFVLEGQDWDATSFRNVETALALLPPHVGGLLGNKDLGPLHIIVNRYGRSLSGKQPYGQAANFFSTNDGKNELVLYPSQSVLTVLHELGHAYNLRAVPAGRYALVLLDPEMESFMAATGWRLLSTPEQLWAARDHMQVKMAYEGGFLWERTSNHDPLEDFANSFALYFYDGERLRALSSERFDWFEANVGR